MDVLSNVAFLTLHRLTVTV